MWLASLLQVAALAGVDPTATPAAASPPAPIHWRQTLFSIPFHVERPDRITQEPVEVQLHVSGDRGLHWDNWAKAKPEKGYFLFKAGTDGEYWFDVRTVDRSGQVRPQGACTPKLIVIVDTAPPKVQLEARRGDAGQITAGFRVDEPYPKLESLAIEYRLGPTVHWQVVPIGQKDIRSNGSEHAGEVTWWPQNAAGTMEIRIRLTDRAGNPAENHAQVALTDPRSPPAVTSGTTTTARPMMPQAAPPQPSAAGPQASLISSSGTAGRLAAAAPAAPPGAAKPAGAPPGEKGDANLRSLGPPSGNTPWPAEQIAAIPMKPAVPAGDSARGPVTMKINPPVTHQFVAQEKSPAVGPPPGVALRWVNSRVFALDFNPKSVGPSGIARLDLWATRDGGKSWQILTTDTQGRSPLMVTVPEDGILGLRMVVQNGAGRAGPAPQPGDKPELWIGIDLTRPVGRITAAGQGTGQDSNKLFITWEALDNRQLASGPIALSFSQRQGGPWTPIASGLENSGRYVWSLGAAVPQRVYLRLEIRDAAGNVGFFETPQPVTIDPTVPSAELRNLQPLGDRYPQPGQSWR